MMIKYAIALAVLLVLALVFTWAFLPARYLPGNRARHLRIRLHLRLHPGKGFAHVVGLWLRWGRLAVLRRSGRIRPGLPLWYRIAEPRQHSVFLGRAHYRHALRVPLEEHLLVMSPPRMLKTAFLADVILRYPGPVIATSTKPDIYALTAAVRDGLGPTSGTPCTPARTATATPSPMPTWKPNRNRIPEVTRMALTINDTIMTSDHTARQAPGRQHEWEVSWLPGQTLDRNTAITAMILADTTAEQDMHEGHRLWPHIQSWAAELGLTAPEVIAHASDPPSNINRQQEQASRQPDREAAD